MALAPPYEYEDVSMTPLRKVSYMCGKCGVLMKKVKEQGTHCAHCGKRGWNVTFKCPKCNEQISKFRQDPADHPPCFSCD